MSKHYGNLEVAGKIIVGLDSESDSYSFPLSTSGASSGQALVLVDSGGKLQLEFRDVASEVTDILDSGNAQSGVIDGVVGQNVYTVTHSSTTDYPVVSLVAPTSASTVGVLGVFDKTDTEFKVVLSSSPDVTGYKISWYLTSSDSYTVPSRNTLSGSTSSLTDGSSATLDIVGYKGYNLYKIETSHAAWVRVYVDDASRTADVGRSELADPSPDAGVVAETITTSGSLSTLFAPAVAGFNNESPVTTNIPISVTNKSGQTTAVTVTITALKTEG